jgi:hypothetical protein
MTRRASCAGKCQVIREVCSSVSAFQMTLSLFRSQLLNNNTCHFPNCKKIFKKCKTNSDRYEGQIEQLQQLLTARFVDFNLDRELSRKFDNPLQVSY